MEGGGAGVGGRAPVQQLLAHRHREHQADGADEESDEEHGEAGSYYSNYRYLLTSRSPPWRPRPSNYS